MTFAELKQALGDWLEKDTTSLPEAIRGTIVNMAIKEYLRILPLRFGEMTTPVNTVASQGYSSLPSAYSRPYSMWYLSDGCKVDIDYLDKEEFDIKYPDSTVTGSVIKHYTIWGNKIYWGPTPDAIIAVNFNYYGYLADLSANEDHNDFTDLAWPAILFKSLQYATLYGIEDARLPVWKDAAIEHENRLVLEHSRKTAGRRPAAREYGYTGK